MAPWRISYQLSWFVCFPDIACNSFPCQNGGVCQPRGNTGYVCNCPAGFDGDNCDLGKNPLPSPAILLNWFCEYLPIVLFRFRSYYTKWLTSPFEWGVWYFNNGNELTATQQQAMDPMVNVIHGTLIILKTLVCAIWLVLHRVYITR